MAGNRRAVPLHSGVFPVDGILKAEHLAFLRRVERTEADARNKAAGYLRRARQTGRQARQAAREAGYSDGLLQFSSAIQELHEERRQLGSHVEMLLRRSLQQVLGRMPKEEWLACALEEVLGGLHRRPEIVIMVHPVNLDALAAAISALARSDERFAHIRAEPDPQISEEGCLVYAGLDVIDLSIPVVVEEMIAALRRMPAAETGPGEGR